jgi:hypothetical protein
MGKSLPLFSARRMIPLQAVALKKYRCGTSPVSKTSDNEDATAALWNSEVLSVQDSVGPPVPEFPQPSENGTKVPSSIARQHARDVLPDHPSGPCAVSKPKKFEGQVATIICQSASETGDTERLARCSANQKVCCSTVFISNFCEIATVDYMRPVMREYRAGEFLNLGKAKMLPAKRLPRYSISTDARANADDRNARLNSVL